MTPISVHDNVVYGQAVDFESGRLVLHAVYWPKEPWVYTDIVFEGVLFHHFEKAQTGTRDRPGNVLFDVTECVPAGKFEEYLELFARWKDYGWPPIAYENINHLHRQLEEQGLKCFEIQPTVGLDGFVVAKSMTFVARTERAKLFV